MALILCGILFISGASALVFETLWFHQAGLTFGNSLWASSLDHWWDFSKREFGVDTPN